MKNYKSILLILFISLSHLAYGQSQQELLFFTSVDAFEKKSDSDADIEDSFVRPAVDVLYSYSGEKFRFLTEYLWSSSENELERMKAGWQTGDKLHALAGSVSLDGEVLDHGISSRPVSADTHYPPQHR